MNLRYEPEGLKIYLFGESVDMRKQMNGLIALWWKEPIIWIRSKRSCFFYEQKERQDQSTEMG